MDAIVKKRRPRGSRDPYVHYRTGKPVNRDERAMDYEIVRNVFGAHRRYACPYFGAALVGRTYDSTRHSFTRLNDMGILQLCERQRENDNERIFGTLYRELGPRGREIAAELGLQLPRYHDDGTFAHTLMLDQVTGSLEIGIKQQDEVKLIYREDLKRSYELPPVGGKPRRMIPDNHRPITLERISNGNPRHIAGIEIETGTNRVTTKDTNSTAVVTKFDHIIHLILSGEMERLYGKQFYWLFVFGGLPRMEWAMENLLSMTKRNPFIRKHVAFKAPHPVYGKKLTGKPRATGHMATEPWARVETSPLYLLQPKEA